MTCKGESVWPLLLLAALGAAACIDEAPARVAALAPDDTDDVRPDAATEGVAHPDAASTTGVDTPDAAPRDAASDSSMDGRAETLVMPASVPDAGVGPSFPPFEITGQPLVGSPGVWTYTEFADTQCRDGSPTGVAINLGSSSNVMIYLEGGGWCIDEESCSGSLDATAAQAEVLALGLVVGVGGVFDRTNQENPLRDWNFVYVPYCTGDLHAGANPDADVPGVGPQKFVGYLNMKKFLQRIVPTFRAASEVLLTGMSAGGYGALFNSVLVQRAFSNVKLKTLSDSGPPLSNAVFAPCLQERQRTLFRLDETFLADCGAACPDPSGYIEDFGVFLARTFSDRPGGLIESAQDVVLRSWFGSGNDNCTAALDYLNPAISGPAYRAALLAFRERVRPFAEYGTFYLDDELHTWTSGLPLPGVFGDDFYAASAGGVRMVDWFTRLVNGNSPGHAGP